MSREYQLILWGATGFTGQLVAEHLFKRIGWDSMRWALGGRSREKLEHTRQQLGRGAGKIDLITGDSTRPEDMRSLAERADVIVSTVGPYARYGNELVAACARAGTHYCDLTGEVPWMRRMIDAHHTTARLSGAVIVHACGFDSIPFDMGVWMLQNEAMKRFGQPLQRVHTYVRAMRGGLSGGTAASMMDIAEEASQSRRTARLLRNPYALNPHNTTDGEDRDNLFGFGRDELIGDWVGPFFMAGVNTRIVRRTNALTGYRYGRDFRYSEYLLGGDGFAGAAKAAAISVGSTTMMLAAAFKPTRALLRQFVLPKSGQGPNETEREAGFFRLYLAGIDRAGNSLGATLTGERDPGYGSTSRMLGESALSLASREPIRVNGGGGFSTPAAALGADLAQRLLRHAGLTFEVDTDIGENG
ncbi:MAG: saccharopine dehydrogenase NADP-binding domain-containing protein [Pseudomonadota bacterium]